MAFPVAYSDAPEVAAIQKWLSGHSIEVLHLPDRITSDIKKFVNDCRHRKLINNSVADATDISNNNNNASCSNNLAIAAAAAASMKTSSVTLKVAQVCAGIIRSLVEWYVREELSNAEEMTQSIAASVLGVKSVNSLACNKRGDSATFDGSNTNAEASTSTPTIPSPSNAAATFWASLKPKGSSIHSYVAMAALYKRYIAEEKDLASVTVADVTATQLTYLILLIDKVGRRLAAARAFQGVASSVTMRSIAIVKKALEAPNVLVASKSIVQALGERYGKTISFIAKEHNINNNNSAGGSICNSSSVGSPVTATTPNTGGNHVTFGASSVIPGEELVSEVNGSMPTLDSMRVARTAGILSSNNGGNNNGGMNRNYSSHENLGTFGGTTTTRSTTFGNQGHGQAMARVDTQVDLSLYDGGAFDHNGSSSSSADGDETEGSHRSSSVADRSGGVVDYLGGAPVVGEAAFIGSTGEDSSVAAASPIGRGGNLSFEEANKSNANAGEEDVDDEENASGDPFGADDINSPVHHTLAAVGNFALKYNSVKQSMVEATNGMAVNLKQFAHYCTEELDAFQLSLDAMTDGLASRASAHIYDGETVLTIGCSHSTLAFFSEAARTRHFCLIVLEGAGDSHGSTNHLAAVLHSINPNVIVKVQPESSAFAVMSNCSKVFVSCDSVLATGGALCPQGTLPVCIAAKAFSTPVIVVAMTVKLIPWLPLNPQCSSLIRISKTENHEQNCAIYTQPSVLLPARLAVGSTAFGSTSSSAADVMISNVTAVLGNKSVPTTCSIDVVHNTVEYLPPHLISLVVTDTDEFVVQHVNRYIRELYRIEDSEL